jgi:hypothetical protein
VLNVFKKMLFSDFGYFNSSPLLNQIVSHLS